MKHKTILAGMILFVSAITAQAGNPVIQGNYADPEGVKFGKQFWIYPTYSDLYEKQVFMDCFSSDDMVTWKKHERIIDTSAVKWAKIAMWAPSIIEKGGKYYLFFAANDIQSNDATGGIGVAVSNKPSGPFKDLLGKPLIDKIVNGAQPIDQFVFRDGKQYYMIYGGWRHCNIVKLKSDFTGLEPFPDGTIYKEITPKDYVEGPVLFKRDGKYYFMWSEGSWGGPDYRVAYAIADSPMGPFIRETTVLQQDPEIATSAGHHSVIVNGDDYFMVYHRRPKGSTARDNRVTCIDRMEFDAQGKILPVKMTFEGVGKQKPQK